MNILILDDMPERHEGFKRILSDHSLTHVWTFSQCVKAMKKQKFDMVCLDHDLGDALFQSDEFTVKIDSPNFHLEFSPDFVNDGMYTSSRRFLDGRDVCEWMVNNEFRCPKKVLIHSHNPSGAQQMKTILNTISWIEVVVLPFSIKD